MITPSGNLTPFTSLDSTIRSLTHSPKSSANSVVAVRSIIFDFWSVSSIFTSVIKASLSSKFSEATIDIRWRKIYTLAAIAPSLFNGSVSDLRKFFTNSFISIKGLSPNLSIILSLTSIVSGASISLFLISGMFIFKTYFFKSSYIWHRICKFHTKQMNISKNY